ncbi:hypothetical protein ANTRET_LOCUS8949 [Anthophora retusa]
MPSYNLRFCRSGKLFLTCLILTILWTSSNARFYDDHFKSLSRDHSWSRIDRDVPLDFASSEISPSSTRFSESRSQHPVFDSSETYDKPKEWYSTSATKKIPMENKNFKKVISPFYTITEKDSQKYRDMVMKSGVPYCQEIQTKRSDKEAKDSLTCYKCKNPKNGATYEQCSYVSQPSSDSSNVHETIIKPSGFRNRRSNSEDSPSSYRGSSGYRKYDNPYRFNEKIFSDATEDVPSEYKNKNEKCEKVVRDSMVCMVCRDTKSNAKYEQCSYVHQPTEKRYAYTKSSSFKNPEKESGKEDGEDTKRSGREYSESKPIREYSHSDKKEEPERESREESKDSSRNCKKVEKDSQTCTVCKDPKTGGNYEKCSYTYQPDDKVYKYSRSKSFGYPKGSSSKEDPSYDADKSSEKSRSEPDDYSKDYSIPESYFETYQSSPSSSYFKDEEPSSGYSRAASENSKSTSDDDDSTSNYEKSKSQSQRIAESIEPSNCKEVQKDSMTCRVCKDPKTGSNSEQCSYKYQPSDKSYSYSKSKSFGSPTETEDKSYGESERKESREPSYENRSYDYSTEKSPYVTDSDTGTEFSSSSDAKPVVKEESPKSTPKKVDVDFYDAFKKKAEIQKVLQEFQKEDRSNCKKLMRDKMTCYQCLDEKGFQKEECAFVTSEEPAEDKVDYREVKEYQVEPTKKVPRSIITENRFDDDPVDAEVSANERVYVKREKPDAKSSEEVDGSKEVEPYEYVAETRPVFDKILGFTLPAYMLSTSEHEEEFDKIVSSRRL